MYSFAQRADTQVYDEPLYAHYLSQTDAHEYHPGAKEVLENMENNGQKVIEWMLGPFEKPIVFFKQMTHFLIGMDLSFLDKTINIILTRDPKEMLPSYAKQIQNPAMQDVGYQKHLEILNHLQKRGQKPVVMTSERVLKNPETVLRRLCNIIDIPFDRAMLQWEKGARPEDGSWAKYWYHNIHNSTGFKKYQPKTEPFPEHLKPLLRECQPIYEKLEKLSI